MIIDSHAQLVTKEAIDGIPEKLIGGYTTMFRDMGSPGLDDTIKDMDEAGIAKSVVVAIDAGTTFDYRVTNDMVAAAVRLYPDRLIGFASVDPHKGDKAAGELRDALTELRLKGLKIVPNLIEMYADDRRLYPLYEIARDSGVPVLFHTGTLFYTGVKMKFGQPLPLDEVAVDFPGLTIIMAHFGFPWFHEALAIARRNPNVYFNIAGWRPRYLPAEVIKAIDGQLRRKALFGSDYPLLKRKMLIDEINALGLKEETLRCLLYNNAGEVLRLDT